MEKPIQADPQAMAKFYRRLGWRLLLASILLIAINACLAYWLGQEFYSVPILISVLLPVILLVTGISLVALAPMKTQSR